MQKIKNNLMMNKKKLPAWAWMVGIRLNLTSARKREIAKNLIKLRQNDKNWLAHGSRQTPLKAPISSWFQLQIHTTRFTAST